MLAPTRKVIDVDDMNVNNFVMIGKSVSVQETIYPIYRQSVDEEVGAS